MNVVNADDVRSTGDAAMPCRRLTIFTKSDILPFEFQSPPPIGIQPMGKSVLYVIVPFCSIFIVVGGWLMVHAGRKIALGTQARHWPYVTGRLLSVESKDTSSSEGQSREIQVRYAYSVDSRDYESSTIHPSYGSSSFEQAHRGLESLLQPAKEVRVYYDAAQPDRSMLSVGFYSCSLALLFGGLIFLSSGVGFLLTFWFALAGNQNFAAGITIIQ